MSGLSVRLIIERCVAQKLGAGFWLFRSNIVIERNREPLEAVRRLDRAPAHRQAFEVRSACMDVAYSVEWGLSCALRNFSNLGAMTASL